MPKNTIDRRSVLAAGLASTVVTIPTIAAAQPQEQKTRWQKGRSPWPLCMDTATIRPASLKDKIKIAAEAGFDAIEPWEGELRDYEAGGGNLADLGKMITDAGLFVPSVIGLWNAIPPIKEAWEEQLPKTRDRMRMASAIGSEFVQVIPQPNRGRGKNSTWRGRLRNIASSLRSASTNTT